VRQRGAAESVQPVSVVSAATVPQHATGLGCTFVVAVSLHGGVDRGGHQPHPAEGGGEKGPPPNSPGEKDIPYGSPIPLCCWVYASC